MSAPAEVISSEHGAAAADPAVAAPAAGGGEAPLATQESPEQSVAVDASADASEEKAKKKKKEKPKKLSKAERMAKKAADAAEKAAQAAEANKGTFGVMPRIQSQEITQRTWTALEDLTPELAGTSVLVRARVHRSQTPGSCFLTLRRGMFTAQAIVSKPKPMIKFAGQIKKESIVDIEGTVTVPPAEITSVTQGHVEVQVERIFVVSEALGMAPFSVEEASAPVAPGSGHKGGSGDEEDEAAAAGGGGDASAGADGEAGSGAGDASSSSSGPATKGAVGQFLRLNHRWIDLRTPANQAIMRVNSGVCALFREFLLRRKFVEIQTPKLIGGTSEGGSEVFRIDYFGKSACLAQSPQLYKQMAAACSDLERVFEIGPVFRAELSFTHRHLCEFHGLDMEMSFNEHYYEVLDVFSDLFSFIFEGLETRYRDELKAVAMQYPFEPFKHCKPALRLTFAEGIAMLKEAGVSITDDHADLNTEQERALGRIVKERYDTDFFMLDKFPLAIRPFYTMPDPSDPLLSNSYDFFMRGEEILSGAQRIHDPVLLAERAEKWEIPLDTIQWYIDSFKDGAHPHAGGGVGLERVVMLYLGLDNIRKAGMFPRDPKRIFP